MNESRMISVVIPTYNRGSMLCKTLPSVLQQDYPDYEIVIVDQTPSYPESIQRELDQWKNRIRWIHLEQPNVSRARNVGIRESRGQWIVFIDDDVEIPADYLTRLSRHLDIPNLGIVAGLMRPDQEGSLEPILAEVSHMYYVPVPSSGATIIDVPWISGCSAAYRKAALVDVGLFDDYLGQWCEDADISVRIRARGYRLLLDTSIQAINWNALEGGEDNRNPLLENVTAQRHVRLFSYFLFKQRTLLGMKEVVRGLWQSYRFYALNTRVLRRGIGVAVQRQSNYMREIGQAWKDYRLRQDRGFQ